jgi:hypothetical protein
MISKEAVVTRAYAIFLTHVVSCALAGAVSSWLVTVLVYLYQCLLHFFQQYLLYQPTATIYNYQAVPADGYG